MYILAVYTEKFSRHGRQLNVFPMFSTPVACIYICVWCHAILKYDPLAKCQIDVRRDASLSLSHSLFSFLSFFLFLFLSFYLLLLGKTDFFWPQERSPFECIKSFFYFSKATSSVAMINISRYCATPIHARLKFLRKIRCMNTSAFLRRTYSLIHVRMRSFKS